MIPSTPRSRKDEWTADLYNADIGGTRMNGACSYIVQKVQNSLCISDQLFNFNLLIIHGSQSHYTSYSVVQATIPLHTSTAYYSEWL